MRKAPGLALQPGDQLVAAPDVVGVVGLDLEVLAQARQRLGKDPAADEDLGLHGGAHSMNLTKLATGSRSVTSVFSIASGSRVAERHAADQLLVRRRADAPA